jgi:hypothetical protein
MQQLEIVRKEQSTLEHLLKINARPGADLSAIVSQEIMYLEALAFSKPDILKCEPQSIVLAMRSVIKSNLSLDPYAGLVYVKTRSVNTGTKQAPNWKSVLEITPTCNGLISIMRQEGRILDYTNPQVEKDSSGKVIKVSMRLLLPSYGSPRWEDYSFDEGDFMRWRKASHKDNSRNQQNVDNTSLNFANANYTSFNGGIDPEFARAKCIRHSLKKLGRNPNETAARVYDVPKTQVVDPTFDEEAQFVPDEDFISHVEINSTVSPSTSSNSPTSDEL